MYEDENTFDAVRSALGAVRMHKSTAAILARGTRLRRRRRARPVLAAAALATAGGALVTAHRPPVARGGATPVTSKRHPDLASWTVTKEGDGVVEVTIRELRDVGGLQADLRDEGVPAVVTTSLAFPAGCSNYENGRYKMRDLVRTVTQSGMPGPHGVELLIKPAEIPKAALLWLGVAQTGAPAGSPGPAGPIGSGLVVGADCG